MGGSVSELRPTLTEASSILLLAPAASEFDDHACIDLLTTSEPSATNVLSVTLAESPDERIAIWQHEVAAPPKRGVVVDAGRGRRSPASVGESRPPPSITVDTLAPEAEPVDVGIAVARWLGRWEPTAESTAFCLHSLTTLLDAFGRDDVVSLVSGLNRLCETVGVTAHHHVDAVTADEALLATLRPLYDAVVEHVPGDGWTVTCAPVDADAPSFRRSTTPPGGVADTDPDVPETIPIPYSFDRILDLISVARRRTLLYHLKDAADGTVPLDDVVDAVFGREQSIPVRESPTSRDAVRTSLVHVHLPQLVELGIVDYGDEREAIEYHGNPALESFLRYLETLELG
jgi:hypothetical protein